jgi:hypothetical protein
LQNDRSIKYLLILELSQSHVSLDLDDWVKDSLNKVEFTIAVNKLFYGEVSIGDSILKSFRSGSFFVSGSIGSWNIKVLNKQVKIN